MRVGYGRVSTRDQHTEAQLDALLAAGVEPGNIYVEKISTRATHRPQLEAARKMLRPGDTLVVTKIDRLARSLLDLLGITDDLRRDGITLEVLSGTFNRSDPLSDAMFKVAAVFAELERELTRQRTLEGLEAARKRGRVGGRKHKLNEAQAAEAVRMFHDREVTGYSVKYIAGLFGISRDALYDYAHRAEAA